MDRLISADALKKALRKQQIESLIAHNEEKNVFDVINEQPTAYDVEKVVAELESKEDDCGCGKITVWEALDIVKKGRMK